jgi:hypothetical protein
VCQSLFPLCARRSRNFYVRGWLQDGLFKPVAPNQWWGVIRIHYSIFDSHVPTWCESNLQPKRLGWLRIHEMSPPPLGLKVKRSSDQSRSRDRSRAASGQFPPALLKSWVLPFRAWHDKRPPSVTFHHLRPASTLEVKRHITCLPRTFRLSIPQPHSWYLDT